jgi:hypothetical protein
MKRTLGSIATAFLMLAVLGAGAVSAHDATGDHQGAPATHHTGAPAVPTFSAHCSGAHAGGTIKVGAKVHHAVRGKTLVGTASAAFTGGPAAVNLDRRGHSFKLRGKIPVPATQAVGPVVVTVSITYDGATTVLTCTSKIHLPRK